MNPFDKYNNQADVLNIDKWLAQQQALQGASKTTQAPKSKGNFLTHLLPTIGGTGGGVAGGAAGGALAGTAILPGVGTVAGGLVGALLGGAAGGAAGKVAENKVEGDKNLLSGVAGQAAEQGVLSAGPLRLLKGASAATRAGAGAVKEGGSLADAIAAAGQSSPAPGFFSRAAKDLVTQGQAAQGRVAGISGGQKVAGKELTTQDTAAMLQTLKGEGIKTGNANNQFRDLQDKLNQYGKQISSHFTSNNTPLTRTEVNGIAKDYLAGLKTSDPTILAKAKVVVTDLKNNVNDTKSLWQFRKTLDKTIPDAKYGTDEAVTAKVAAMKAMRQHITKQLGDVPGASNYHALSEIKPFMAAEARRANNPGGGIVGRVAGSGPIQKIESSLGKAAENTGNVLGGSVSPFGLKSVASRTLPVGALQAAGAQVSSDMPTQTSTDSPMSTSMSNNSMDPLSQNGGDLSSALLAAQQGSASPYSQDNLIHDMKRDPKNADKYISTYESLDKIFNPTSTGSTIKPTGQQYGLATGGYNALQQLSQLIGQDSSVVNKNATPGQGLPLVGSLITNASGSGDYHALSDNVLQSLIHLQTGATATPEEVKSAKGQLPQPGDSPEVQQRKLNNLASMFAPWIQGGQLGSTSSSGGDLASVLAQLGYQ